MRFIYSIRLQQKSNPEPVNGYEYIKESGAQNAPEKHGGRVLP